MELQYTETKTMLIEGHESCRVPVPVKRCPLSKLDGLHGETNNHSSYPNNNNNNSAIDNNNRIIDLERICSEHIANLVDLRWHLNGIETDGKASLKGITLSADMLDEVRMSPLAWGKWIYIGTKYYS